MPDAPRTFVDRTFAKLKEAIAELGAAVPEVEGVGVVVLWRMNDQASIPSVMVQGVEGPLANPDQLLRMHLATLRLEQFCVDKNAESIVALRKLASDLAREARQAHAQAELQAATQGNHPDADGDHHQDPAG